MKEQPLNPSVKRPHGPTYPSDPTHGASEDFAVDPDRVVDVLIVDDEKVNLMLLREYLRTLPVNMVEANNGVSAVNIVASGNYDFALILLDVMMPGMDGFQTAEALQELPGGQAVPIMFITALGRDREYLFKGYEAGGVDYLVKPIEPEILIGKVSVFLEMHRHKLALSAMRDELERTVEQLRRSEEALRTSQKHYKIVADYNFDFEAWIGPEGDFLYVSPSCERLTGYTPDKFQSDPDFLRSLIHPDDLSLWDGFKVHPHKDDSGHTLDFRILDKFGAIRWVVAAIRQTPPDEDGSSTGVRVSLRDVTKRKQAEEQLSFESLHDSLTGLPNRALCLDRITHAAERAKRRKGFTFAVVFIDLDRFKLVNDSFGHIFGDRLLIAVADRMHQYIRRVDTISRFGGDEFILILEELVSQGQAIRIIKRMQAAMAQPFYLDDKEIRITASFGVMFGPDAPGENPEDILQSANLAMYKAKEVGRDTIKVFNTRLKKKFLRVLSIENDMRSALANKEFYIVLQPIISMRSGRLIGFEALARWNSPTRGTISPAEFIPIAEETGLIIELGEYLLEKACTLRAQWAASQRCPDDLVLAVNISARQFSQSLLWNKIQRTMNRTQCNPKGVKLEITETTIMNRPDKATSQLQKLKNLGLTLSIDDFGTGYSSMSYLKRFPLDQLKIDLSFVRRIDTDKENREIVRAIIALAHNLGLEVVAEGIETPKHLQILRDLGCEYGQGFLFSRPIEVKGATALALGEKKLPWEHFFQDHKA